MTSAAPTQWVIADVWETIARTRPTAACVSRGTTRLDWARFDRHADGFAGRLLADGLGAQAKVGLAVRNGPEFLIGVFGCLKAGLVPVNTNFRYTAVELAHVWNSADVECVVFSAGITASVAQARPACPRIRSWFWVGDSDAGADAGADAGSDSGSDSGADAGDECPDWATPFPAPAGDPGPVRPPWGRSPDDLILLYTGGTTGVPKGVMWRQDDVFAILNSTAAIRYPPGAGLAGVARKQAEDSDRPRFLPCGPLVHAAAAFAAYGVLGAGGSIVLLTGSSFDAVEVLDTIDAEQVTHLSIIGEAHGRPLADRLIAEPRRWSLTSLRLITSAGMALLPATRATLLGFSPGAACVDILGSSEAPLLGRARTSATQAAPAAAFVPGPNVRVVDESGRDVAPGSDRVGVIVTRGRTPLGYYNDPGTGPPLFRVIDGERWVVSGDLASIGPDGVLQLRGRASSVINTGGEKVYAHEVEDALRAHPAVSDAAVIGLPHDRLGQVVVAAVQPVADSIIDPAELTDTLRVTLAGYKVPRQIFVLASLGRGENGKIDQPALTRRLAALAGGDRPTRVQVARSRRRS